MCARVQARSPETPAARTSVTAPGAADALAGSAAQAASTDRAIRRERAISPKWSAPVGCAVAFRAVRILLASPGMGLGGAERVVSSLASGLLARGHEVAISGAPGPLDQGLDDVHRLFL